MWDGETRRSAARRELGRRYPRISLVLGGLVSAEQRRAAAEELGRQSPLWTLFGPPVSVLVLGGLVSLAGWRSASWAWGRLHDGDVSRWWLLLPAAAAVVLTYLLRPRRHRGW